MATSADLNEMSFQNLRQTMISQGQKPKKMKRERMIHWLKDNLSFPETAEAIFSPEPKTDSPGVEATVVCVNSVNIFKAYLFIQENDDEKVRLTPIDSDE